MRIESMSTEPDPKIIELIQASAKDALPEGQTGFQSLEFFPPRTDTVRYVSISWCMTNQRTFDV